MSGFLKFDTILLNELITRKFTQNEFKLILLILRLSKGCCGKNQKNFCAIRKKKEIEACGIPEQCINRTVKKLIEQNIIYEWKDRIKINNKEHDIYCYALNEDSELWTIPYIQIETSQKTC